MYTRLGMRLLEERGAVRSLRPGRVPSKRVPPAGPTRRGIGDASRVAPILLAPVIAMAIRPGSLRQNLIGAVVGATGDLCASRKKKDCSRGGERLDGRSPSGGRLNSRPLPDRGHRRTGAGLRNLSARI